MATADNQYTSLDFLSKIRLQPKKNLLKQLSLDIDLEQINQVLSPKAKPTTPSPQHNPNAIDRQLTRRFVVQLITNYEGEEAATAKWEGFLESISNEGNFELFVQSLKEIREEKPQFNSNNPESPTPVKMERQARSSSCEKVLRKQEQKKINGPKDRIRQQILGLKELLMAGEKFLRQNVNDYS